jgi:hypothetical protein
MFDAGQEFVATIRLERRFLGDLPCEPQAGDECRAVVRIGEIPD